MHLLLSLLLFQLCVADPGLPQAQVVLDAATFDDADSITAALKDAEVIPEVLPTSFIPSVALSLVFVDPGEHVDLGNVIPVPSTSSRPAFALKPVDIEVPAGIPTRTLKPNQTLTLVLSDPDATSRSDPVKGQMCHWIATGIRAPPAYHQADVADGVTYTGRRVVGEPSPSGPYHYKELIKYMQPAPPPKTGSHRYVFVLLAPKSGSGGDTGLKKPSERPHFGYGEMGKGIMDWAEDNGLEPIGANFFYAQDEEQ